MDYVFWSISFQIWPALRVKVISQPSTNCHWEYSALCFLTTVVFSKGGKKGLQFAMVKLNGFYKIIIIIIQNL